MDSYPHQSYLQVYGMLREMLQLMQQGYLSPIAYGLVRDHLIDSHFRNLQAYEVRLRGGAS